MANICTGQLQFMMSQYVTSALKRPIVFSGIQEKERYHIQNTKFGNFCSSIRMSKTGIFNVSYKEEMYTHYETSTQTNASRRKSGNNSPNAKKRRGQTFLNNNQP